MLSILLCILYVVFGIVTLIYVMKTTPREFGVSSDPVGAGLASILVLVIWPVIVFSYILNRIVGIGSVKETGDMLTDYYGKWCDLNKD